MNKTENKTFTKYMVLLLILIGVLARGVLLGSVPGGINMDEAFGAYEGYSLLHYGVDSHGYAFPVYLETWGSGMSALNSYLMIPFLFLFGPHTWVSRLPQFLASCFTLPVVYKLLERLVNQKAALIGLFYLAVSPWSIMSARWGIDCNLAPAFLLFGFYFFVLGADNAKYFMLSALFYGLSLYCYITIWPVMPFMLAFMILYLILARKIRFNRYTVISVVILGVLSVPLILFLLVNNGYIPEITTPFLSIPKLSAMRGSEISFSDKLWKLKKTVLMMLKQYDGLYWNATEEFGLYYKGFLLFGVIGGCYAVYRFVRSIIKKQYDGISLLLFPFLCAVVLGSLITVNFNRINCIHIPISIFIGLGLYLVSELPGRIFAGKRFSGKLKFLRHADVLVYVLITVCFICFESYYFTTFRLKIAKEFQEGLGDSVAYAMQLADDDTIYVEDGFIYSKILYYSRIPAPEYKATVTYKESRVSTFGQFYVEPETFPDTGVCIILPRSVKQFEENGWTVKEFGYSAVAYK